jgi:hypothetical protein
MKAAFVQAAICPPVGSLAVDAKTAIALVAVLATALVAVIVPYVTFRLSVGHDQARWLREQRAALYVDVLIEVHAEQQWFEYATSDDDTRERMSMYFEDLRLPSPERARLAARGTVFGSRAVNARFNQLEGILARSSLIRPGDEGERSVVRVNIGDAADALQSAIRRELGADDITLAARPKR